MCLQEKERQTAEPWMSLYLVFCTKLSEESFPVSQVVVHPVITGDIEICQNPQTTTPHLQVHRCVRDNKKR